MALIQCPECRGAVSDRAPACPHCGFPIGQQDFPEEDEEMIVHVDSPAMLRAHPLGFLLCLLLCLVGVGIPILLVWWIRCRGIRLIVTTRRTTLRTGILAKVTCEVRHRDVRDLIVSQSLLQRLLGVGELEIVNFSDGEVNIDVDGIRDPQGVADLIRHYQG